METEGRGTDAHLAALRMRGVEFNFFQAVRLLAQRMKGTVAPDSPKSEIVRFGAHQSLAFPPSDIASIETEPESFYDPSTGETTKNSATPPRLLMKVAFFGLTGPNGVLPHHYTERIIARLAARPKDTVLADFLDLFNHRLISWFYRAWEKHKVWMGLEREWLSPARPVDGFSQYLRDLIGLGTPWLQKRLRVPDAALVFYAGLLTQRPRSASALAGMLRDYFGVGVDVEEFHGEWLQLAPWDRTQPRAAAHNGLGVDSVAGDAVWDPQAAFRVRVGPLSFDRFRAFLPGAEAFIRLVELTRFFVGPSLRFNVLLVLTAEEVPCPRLTGDVEDTPRPGWVAWLKTDPFECDAADAEFAGVN